MKKRREVLILEDSDVQRFYIAETLKQSDVKILFAKSIREAKNIFNGNGSDIALFILDLKLPDGNGLDFLKYVRKSSNYTPAIIESSFISNSIKDNIKELGIVALFEKPINPHEFNQTVSNILIEKGSNKNQIKKRN